MKWPVACPSFFCMYGYNTTLSDDVKRFSFLKGLGVLPFVQEFQPVDDSPVPGVTNYFDIDPDALLSIYFRLNGRNFEGFLKWVSRKYVEEFGREKKRGTNKGDTQESQTPASSTSTNSRFLAGACGLSFHRLWLKKVKTKLEKKEPRYYN